MQSRQHARQKPDASPQCAHYSDPTVSALLALVLLGVAAPPLQAEMTTAPAIPLDLFPPIQGTESFQLDMAGPAVADRGRLDLFSQTVERGAANFVLPSRDQVPAADDSVPATQPLPTHYTTTAQFDGPFKDQRAVLARGVLAAAPDLRLARQLDFAQFLIARMMLPEARGALAALPAEMDPLSADRAAGYLAIIARLSGGPPAALPPAWDEDPLWPVVLGPAPQEEARLRGAARALAQQTRDVATAALPLLVDTALASGHTTIAAEILAAAPAGTDLDGTGLLDLMRGQLALAQGAEDLAFDNFARVAEGHDRAAIEARIALADLALKRNDPALLPKVSDLLQEGLPRWRGDDAALRLRVRLARVAEDMGDIATAMDAMSMILREHPGTPEAELADTRLGVMAERLAQAIVDPATSLPEALADVRRLDLALSARVEWLGVRMALAQRLTDAGLIQAAKAEYAAITLPASTALPGGDPATLDTLAVKHATLLLGLGDDPAARAALDRRAFPQGSEQLSTLVALRLQAGGTTILPAPLLAATKEEHVSRISDPEVQLALARVARMTGQTDAALAAYDLGLDRADQTERLVASLTAAEIGDAARAGRYANGLTGDRAALRQAAVAALAAPRRSGESLSVSGASALITAAAEAGEAVDALLGDAGP